MIENKNGWSQVLTAVSTGGLGRSSNIPELLVILQKRVTGAWTAAFLWAPASHAGAGAWTGGFSGYESLKGLKDTPFTRGGALGYACWATLRAATAPPSGQS